MPEKEKPKDFGRYLQKHRTRKGISLEAVSRVTRISMTSLHQIENEDSANLPAAVFVKGFLRAYADMVGIDARPVLERYEVFLASQSEKRPVPVERESGKPFALKALAALFLLIVTVVLTVMAYNTWYAPRTTVPQQPVQSGQGEAASNTVETPHPARETRTEEQQASVQEKKPEATAPAEEPARPEEAVTEQTDDMAQPETDNPSPPVVPGAVEESSPPVSASSSEQAIESKAALRLRIKALEQTWLKITADEKEPKEYTMEAGEEMEVTAETTFNVLIGNAGGLDVWFNDQPVELPGISGKVVRLKLP